MNNTLTKDSVQIGSYVEFKDKNNTYRGVVTNRTSEVVVEVDVTSRLIKGENFYKLYTNIPVYDVPRNIITVIKCNCDRVFHETILSDRGHYFESAFCPDCFWDCVS
tara:strand:+ start:29 stop:349 length:321 start_codon:yes stop_codon:yes gene_type:complete